MDAVDIIQKFGWPLGTLIVVLMLGARKVWCFGYQLTERDTRIAEMRAELIELRAMYEARLEGCQKREDEWKELALTGGQVAKDALVVMKRRGGS
jgi:hypothetical protein